MIELKVKEYQNSDKEKWDAFVMKHSINGTFLQTKNFLDYHKDRFQDASIILYKRHYARSAGEKIFLKGFSFRLKRLLLIITQR